MGCGINPSCHGEKGSGELTLPIFNTILRVYKADRGEVSDYSDCYCPFDILASKMDSRFREKQ